MAEEDEAGYNESDDVKKYSKDQRDALPSEPVCAVCGRYGEYVCDATDDDICSLECKELLLSERQNPQRRIPVQDECYYVSDSIYTWTASTLSHDQIDSLRNKLEIIVKGSAVPPPILSFGSCRLPSKLVSNIEQAGFELPTSVQMQAIPGALAGKSLLVSADTGSGKTAAYLIPIVALCVGFRSIEDAARKMPLAIVLAPTRELCIQVEDEAKKLAKGLQFKTALVVGGDPIASQIYRIDQGVELIVATPGRLIDVLIKQDMKLDDVKIFALDEVDCMLQKGFRAQVLQISRALYNPQALMFSATISPEVEKLAGSIAKDVVHVAVGRPNNPSKAVRQTVIWVESKRKKKKLFEILMSKEHFMPPAVVYVGSKVGADLLCEAITVTTGLKALSIHGDKAMKERRERMSAFLMGDFPVMVATGVLGRGVDLLKVKQVIIFDMPNSVDEYTHQVGRASRMGEEGSAIVFVNEESKHLFPEFVEILKANGTLLPRELMSLHNLRCNVFGGKSNRKRRRGC